MRHTSNNRFFCRNLSWTTLIFCSSTVVLFPLCCTNQSWLVYGQSSSTTTTKTTWSGCINPSGQDPKIVTIGKPTTICLQIGNRVDWSSGAQYIRTSFQPIADEYSRFHIPNTYRDLVVNTAGTIFTNNNVTVGALSQLSYSFLRLYYDFTSQKIYPFLTAILNVRKGQVRGITWDNACVFCGGFADRCEENTYNFNGLPVTTGQPTKSCFLTKSQCDGILKTTPNSTACDITLYTVWSGTDATGNAFQSQAYRFSLFPPQQISDRITQLIPTFGLEKSVPNLLDSLTGSNTTNSTTTPSSRMLGRKKTNPTAAVEVTVTNPMGEALKIASNTAAVRSVNKDLSEKPRS